MNDEVLSLLSTISVLIAEDDEIARETIAEGLRPCCKAVNVARDGYEGVELFNKFNPDIILTDIHMPLMNGFDMMKEILRVKPRQKFIIFTSYDTDHNLIKSIKQGATLFLKKPIDMQTLRGALVTLTFKNEDELVKISDGVSINLAKEKIYKDGQEIYLTFLQNRLFWLLAYNLNSLVSYEMIDEFVYSNEPTSKNSVQKAILRLKNELNLNIKNIFDGGYMLCASK
ncbi:response regulator transcription factor [Campylobacter sp. 7477a]|uniref:response regulator transcription factor n=1 Tax=Campylobacter sp. 7477a TaxID=2735741 RepID=UPI0030148BA5|nr:response regulator [Campylobacter sp. 7477a]